MVSDPKPGSPNTPSASEVILPTPSRPELLMSQPPQPHFPPRPPTFASCMAVNPSSPLQPLLPLTAPMQFSYPIAEKIGDKNFLVWEQQVESILHGHYLHNFLSGSNRLMSSLMDYHINMSLWSLSSTANWNCLISMKLKIFFWHTNIKLRSLQILNETVFLNVTQEPKVSNWSPQAKLTGQLHSVELESHIGSMGF